MIPDNASIEAHLARFGGLWLVVPAAKNGKQPRPFFAALSLRVNRDTGKTIPNIEGGCLHATVSENENLSDAKWYPVASDGSRIEEKRLPLP